MAQFMFRKAVQGFKFLAHLTAPGCSGIKPQYGPIPVKTSSYSLQAGSLDQTPKISIVIPSFNQARYLPQTIESVLDQDYPALELIVVDGASADHTTEVIRNYSAELDWWVSEPDSGQAEAINKGFRKSSGEIMAWLNSDDMLMPGALVKVAEHFVSHPGTDVVYGHRVLVNEEGLDVGRWVLPRHGDFILSAADYIPQETMFWRRSIWERSGGYINENFQFALDWELIVRFLEAEGNFFRLPAFLGQFRVHDQQKTAAQIEQIGFQEMERIRNRFVEKHSRPWVRAGMANLRLLNLAFFMLKAKATETAWRWGLVKID